MLVCGRPLLCAPLLYLLVLSGETDVGISVQSVDMLWQVLDRVRAGGLQWEGKTKKIMLCKNYQKIEVTNVKSIFLTNLEIHKVFN